MTQVFDIGVMVDKSIASDLVECSYIFCKHMSDYAPDAKTLEFGHILACYAASAVLFKNFYSWKYGNYEFDKRASSILWESVLLINNTFIHEESDDGINGLGGFVADSLNEIQEQFGSCISGFKGQRRDVIAIFLGEVCKDICRSYNLTNQAIQSLRDKLSAHILNSVAFSQLI